MTDLTKSHRDTPLTKKDFMELLKIHNKVHDINSLPNDAEIHGYDLATEPITITYTSSTIKREVVNPKRKIGRNESCYCGSGKKYKYCHLN